MNTTKKLLVLIMVAVMAAVSVMPSTFSWYSHNSSADGKTINYTDELPVSMKTSNTSVTMTTVESDVNGVKSDTTVTGASLAPDASTKKAVKYYTTTLTNNGSNTVNLDLNMSNLANNADFAIGTLSPTINEKEYASRAVRTKASYKETRIYFKTHSKWSSFWSVGNGTLNTGNMGSTSNGSTNDINIAYRENGATSDTYAKMVGPYTDNSGMGNSTTNVYYYDIPSDAEYFFFFNHWYMISSSNRNWNSTIQFKDTTTKGRLYYLTGNVADKDYKECKATAVDKKLVAINSYYDTVRMSTGSSVFADIGLKIDSDEEDFIPEYYGNSIKYKVQSGSSCVSVNNDGLITPKAAGSATIRTTITGKFGDDEYVDTSISIPTSIPQVPILQNIVVPYNGATDSAGNSLSNKVEIHWYVINRSANATLSTSSIFFTI